MHTTPTTGIPNEDRPGTWLVPPWAPDASVCDITRHFRRFNPWTSTNTSQLLAYHKGYQAALAAAVTSELTTPAHWYWYEDLRDSVDQCVTHYEEMRTVEIQQANRDLSRLPASANTAPSNESVDKSA